MMHYNSIGETEQAAKVLAFKEELKTKGLIWEYSNASEFPNKFRQHLTTILFEKFKERYRMMPNLPLSFAVRGWDCDEIFALVIDRSYWVLRFQSGTRLLS